MSVCRHRDSDTPSSKCSRVRNATEEKFTQGVSDNWHNELIHVSKNKITKLNKFLSQYGSNIVDPEVVLCGNYSALQEQREMNWKIYFMNTILIFALAKNAHVISIHVL